MSTLPVKVWKGVTPNPSSNMGVSNQGPLGIFSGGHIFALGLPCQGCNWDKAPMNLLKKTKKHWNRFIVYTLHHFS